MRTQDKDMIMAGVEHALHTIPYGRVIIEIRGPNAPTDVVVEQRTRYPVKDSSEKQQNKRETRQDD